MDKNEYTKIMLRKGLTLEEIYKDIDEAEKAFPNDPDMQSDCYEMASKVQIVPDRHYIEKK